MRNYWRRIIVHGFHYLLTGLLCMWLWSLAGRYVTVTRDIPITLAFCNNTENQLIHNAPPIYATVKGTRNLITHLPDAARTLHIDIAKLPENIHTIQFRDHQIFLPTGVHVLDYKPSRITLSANTVST